MSRSNDIAGLTTSILDGVTATEVGLGNVTNESKATMFASPTFTGTVSGVDAGHLTTGTLGNTVQDNITRLGTVTTGTFNGTLGAGMVVNVASNSANTSVNTPSSNGYTHAVELLKVSWQLKTTNPLLVAYFHTQTGTQSNTASWIMDFIFGTSTSNSGFSYSSSNLFSGDITNGSLYSYYSDSGEGDRRRAKILQSAKVITGTAGHYCEVKCEAWGNHSRGNEYYGPKTITVFEVAQ